MPTPENNHDNNNNCAHTSMDKELLGPECKYEETPTQTDKD